MKQENEILAECCGLCRNFSPLLKHDFCVGSCRLDESGIIQVMPNLRPKDVALIYSRYLEDKPFNIPFCFINSLALRTPNDDSSAGGIMLEQSFLDSNECYKFSSENHRFLNN